MKLKPLAMVSVVLLIVGGLNWGLVAVFDFNLVTSLLGEESFLTDAVYVLVSLAALHVAVLSPKLSAEG